MNLAESERQLRELKRRYSDLWRKVLDEHERLGLPLSRAAISSIASQELRNILNGELPSDARRVLLDLAEAAEKGEEERAAMPPELTALIASCNDAMNLYVESTKEFESLMLANGMGREEIAKKIDDISFDR